MEEIYFCLAIPQLNKNLYINICKNVVTLLLGSKMVFGL